ncbi:MAG: response regulator transcription factor, partial [Chloroflexi bacterium]|nr:response regulator transcription factor [Chloroflexota bacterium]
EAAIHRIRNKIQDLDPAWDYIQNVRGQGYQYVPKPG